MGTLSNVLAAWGHQNYKKVGNTYRGHSPIRPGSDGNTFVITAQDEENAPYFDHKDIEGGSLYQLAKIMGVEIVGDGSGNNGAVETLIAYRDLAHYAEVQGVIEETFKAWEWRYEMHWCGQNNKERPALTYMTKGGRRWRYIDGLKPKYANETGKWKPCWYGLNFALDMLKNFQNPTLVLCNGEPSTIVGQCFGVPAVCAPGGERQLGDELIQELTRAMQAKQLPLNVWIVYDCDKQGRDASAKVQKQLQAAGWNAHALDIKLGDKGDLGNYCKLHGDDAYMQLQRIAEYEPLAPNGILSSADVARMAIANIGKVTMGEPLIFPFKAFHKFGGNCRVMAAGEVAVFAGISGGGKTTFAECLTEPLIQRGKRGLWDGKEWNAQKMHARRIQRLTGITTEQQKLYEVWKYERSNGIPESDCEGVALTQQEEQAYLAASDYIATKYVGRIDYMPQVPYLEDTLGLMSERLAYYRRRREPVSFAVFDYVQLWKMRTVNNAPSNLFEYAFDVVKDWTLTENIASFVLTQSTKEATEKVKVHDSTYLLTSADAQYIRDDKSNLMITLTPQYEENRNQMHNGKAALRKLPYIVARAVKNSDGIEGGFVRLEAYWERLMILDKVVPSVKVNLGDD